MQTSKTTHGSTRRWTIVTLAIALAGAATFVPAFHAGNRPDGQEKNAPASADQSTSLSDQTDLALTVYNSNIALIRDVPSCSFPEEPFA